MNVCISGAKKYLYIQTYTFIHTNGNIIAFIECRPPFIQCTTVCVCFFLETLKKYRWNIWYVKKKLDTNLSELPILIVFFYDYFMRVAHVWLILMYINNENLSRFSIRWKSTIRHTLIGEQLYGTSFLALFLSMISISITREEKKTANNHDLRSQLD